MREPNAAQGAAIRHGDGPALVIAGPGSGKTYTIIRRILHLILELGIDPHHILTLTFTKAAAKEMKERAGSMLGADAAYLTFGTFHSVFLSILKHTYGLTAENIIKATDRYTMLRDLIGKAGIETTDICGAVDELASLISSIKTGTFSLEPQKEYGLFPADELTVIYDRYCECMRRARLLDYDDMTIRCRDLFLKEPSRLALWSDRYRYIQIDEFQDIDPIQYETVRMLAGEDRNIYAVGDDDQSIYGFRGADPHMMRLFTEDFESACIYRLEMNYRCAGPIVEAASDLISKNRDRIEKRQTAFVLPGDAVDIRSFDGRESETKAILAALSESGTEDAAVLVRTNELADLFGRMLSERGAGVEMKGRRKDIYDTETGKDIRAYLRLASDRYDRADILRVMNRPERHIGREAYGSEGSTLKDALRYYERIPEAGKKAEELLQDVNRMGRMKPAAAIRYLRRVVGYDGYLAERGIPLKDIETITELASGYGSIYEWIRAIDERGDRCTAADRDTKGSSIKVMTLHACKGLEFDEVFIVDVNKGIVPYHRATEPSDIEEERRLLYVGMTRAKRKLHLFYLTGNRGKKMYPSEFLKGRQRGDTMRQRDGSSVIEYETGESESSLGMTTKD